MYMATYLPQLNTLRPANRVASRSQTCPTPTVWHLRISLPLLSQKVLNVRIKWTILFDLQEIWTYVSKNWKASNPSLGSTHKTITPSSNRAKFRVGRHKFQLGVYISTMSNHVICCKFYSMSDESLSIGHPSIIQSGHIVSI